MPTPCVHSAVAYVAFCAAPKQALEGTYGGRKRLAIFLLVSNLPDLDFIPGILSGDPTLYHHYASHSLLMTALAAALCARFLLKGYYLPLILTAISHPILDIMTVDSLAWYKRHHGIPLLWPLSHHETFPIFHLFSAPYVGPDWMRMFSEQNLAILSLEALMSAAFIFGAHMIKKQFNRWSTKGGLLAR